MLSIPAIDMIKTGENINTLRKKAGLSVKDLQDIFGSVRRRRFTSGSAE